MTKIDRTAVIDAGAIIGEGCEIGPYAIIGRQVKIGKNTRIGAHTVIEAIPRSVKTIISHTLSQSGPRRRILVTGAKIPVL
jgi:acyl-[acyl carrier protein]--UDP-N-acetylglucosamine O-acyltransferase